MKELENNIQSFFGIATPEELAAITSLFQPETLKKGDYFLKTNWKCEKLSFLQSGFLRVFLETENKEVTQWISSKGYFVTDVSGFIFDKPARWNMQALTDVKLCTLPKKKYNELKNFLPNWSELEKQFLAHCFASMEDRIFCHLSMT